MMILIGTLGLGIWYRNRFYERVEMLCKLIEIIELFISEVNFSKATMPECCAHVGRRMCSGGETDKKLGNSLMKVHELMDGNEGVPFDKAFSETMGKCLEDFVLESTDIAVFLKISCTGSYSDGQMQLKALERIRDDLKDTVSELKSEVENRGRIAVGLGAMGGLLLVIVLL